MATVLEHKHLIITAKLSNPPTDTVLIKKWMKKLVSKIRMKVLMGPYAVYSAMEGNRGLTAVTIIETSHIALHVWDEVKPALMQLDVYTCSTLNIDHVFEAIQEFGATDIDYYYIDRNNQLTLLNKPDSIINRIKKFFFGK